MQTSAKGFGIPRQAWREWWLRFEESACRVARCLRGKLVKAHDGKLSPMIYAPISLSTPSYKSCNRLCRSRASRRPVEVLNPSARVRSLGGNGRAQSERRRVAVFRRAGREDHRAGNPGVLRCRSSAQSQSDRWPPAGPHSCREAVTLDGPCYNVDARSVPVESVQDRARLLRSKARSARSQGRVLRSVNAIVQHDCGCSQLQIPAFLGVDWPRVLPNTFEMGEIMRTVCRILVRRQK